jgi:phosphatidylglycerol---prolipoprotein diacylglyceryl transferase
MIDFTPSPILVQIGPISVYWYGIGYAIGLATGFWIITSEARRRGLNLAVIPNGVIIVAAAALVGGRLYHVIDQWQLYKDDPLKIILPPYTGLGAYGGLAAGIVALYLYCRWKRLEFWTWADVAAPAVFVMQGIARWGNFFNQELYGPPTNLPWGIAIECAHRIGGYECPTVPSAITGLLGTTPADTHFQPLFLYESLSGILGAVTLLWLARRFGNRLRPGDLVPIFFIWYGVVRFVLENLRADNWTFFGIPVAQIVSLAFVVGGIITLLYRHRPGAWQTPPPDVAAPPGGTTAIESDATDGGESVSTPPS